ncbi:MAG TPA: hypothetical protein VJU61_06945 [Polyangiaceae bacterium]|nr:hypothetical protein [Polyangiaceae bacterium]
MIERSGPALQSLLVAALALACGGEGGRDRAAEALSPQPMSEPGAPDGSGVIDENGDLVLDELSDSDAHFSSGNISGEWFTYSDGTNAIEPPDHTGLATLDGEAHVSGSGFSDWGAGLSAYFSSVDLTAFDGVRLRARGTGSIIVELATPATSPPGEGGTCMGNGCFGHFATSLQLSEAYQDFAIPFATLAQPSWAQRAELALDGVISLNLVAKVAGGAASLDLWVDRLALHAGP